MNIRTTLRQLTSPRGMLPLLFLSVAAGCGGSDDPTGPSAPMMEEITVSLDEISIVQDCDEGNLGDGEFAYKFYVTEFVDGTEGTTHLSPDYTSFTAGNYTAWDPGASATFTLERRAGVSFRVRLAMRELDQTEDFSNGRFLTHAADGPGAPWAPETGFDLYDASKRTGILTWESASGRSTCEATMTYSVTARPQG